MNYDRIILELLDRVSLLEDEVEKLKKNDNNILMEDEYSDAKQNSAGRDKTKYFLDGKIYGKGRLVLAVIKKYMTLNPDTSADSLIKTFHKSLQGSLGVVITLKDAKMNCSDYERRFFIKPEDIINTTTEDCVVCSEWGISNIGNIITRAKQLGIEIATA